MSTPLTLRQILAEVSRIASLAARDPESAHSAEDRLHQVVLGDIAAGAPYANELAKAALETTSLPFPRWRS